MKITMQEIAERAGCSSTAVSKALRNAPDISEARRKEIQAIAEEMGYSPNPMVSALMASRASKGEKGIPQNVLALISNWPEDDEGDWRFFKNIVEEMEGLRTRAHKFGFLVEEFSLAPDGFSAKRLHQILSTRGIRGLIILPAEDFTELLKMPLEHYCVVALGTREPIRFIHQATTNRFNNMMLLLKKLEKFGYSRPGLVLTEGTNRVTSLQYYGAYLGYTDTSCRMTKLPVHIMKGSGAEKPLHAWLDKKNPDVVIGDIQVLHWIKTAGLQVPEDVSFAAIDHKLSYDDIAGFDSNLREVGVAAVNWLTAQLYQNCYGLPNHPQTMLVNGSWVDGDSAPAKSKAENPIKKA